MIRFAIWAAVSSAAQADQEKLDKEGKKQKDKYSLEDQEDKCRQAGIGRGWKETAGPYIVPGKSRQLWVNLRDAEMAIPELHALLEDAQSGKYDILIMWDFNRLRDLLDMVAKSLGAYHVQICSVSQWMEPVQPEKYSPYTSDATTILRTMSKMVSSLQNNDMRRKYMEHMPKRVAERGLPATSIPYGYRRAPNSKLPPTINQDIAPILITAKDKLLAGASCAQIAEWLDTMLPPPRAEKWSKQTVKSILTNPFYAGILRWGLTRSEYDPRSERMKKNRHPNPDNIITGKGRHEPLWDEYTHHAILQEIHRHGRNYKGKARHTLTSILTCGVCGAHLWTYYNREVKAENLIWRCSSRHEHIAIRDREALHLIGQVLINELINLKTEAPAQSEETFNLRAELSDLQAQRERIGDAYSAGAFNLAEFTARTAPLDDQIAELKHRLEGAERIERDAEARAKGIYHLRENIHHIPAFLERGNPLEVNHILCSVFMEIVVNNGEVELRWR